MASKERRFNDVTAIQAKLRDALAKFQTHDSGNALNGGTIAGLTVYVPRGLH
jgi:hypothetical protein